MKLIIPLLLLTVMAHPHAERLALRDANIPSLIEALIEAMSISRRLFVHLVRNWDWDSNNCTRWLVTNFLGCSSDEAFSARLDLMRLWKIEENELKKGVMGITQLHVNHLPQRDGPDRHAGMIKMEETIVYPEAVG
ncbi:hypothetical protein CspHIS471_0400630 [Cutaneotrichosporon sp. HIS471]|nr:hypothetical protein CspHIS471_0400630 [Cutaneotrichosporon sp. HIS471]